MFYTYIHHRASDNKVFYVGKGKGNRAWDSKGRSTWWTSVKNKHGLNVEIAARWHTEKEAFEHERFLIACLRDMGHKLVNICDGGQGAAGLKHSEEWKQNMSRILSGRKGRPCTEEQKKKLSEYFKQNKPIGRTGKLSKEEIRRRTESRMKTVPRYSEGGFSLTQREWSEKLNMHRSSIEYRIKTGKPLLSPKHSRNLS